jgi:hypothetical protein
MKFAFHRVRDVGVLIYTVPGNADDTVLGFVAGP